MDARRETVKAATKHLRPCSKRFGVIPLPQDSIVFELDRPLRMTRLAMAECKSVRRSTMYNVTCTGEGGCMSIELWLAFVAASAVLLIIPGPTILTVISYAIARGRPATGALVAGVALGDSTALVVSLIGLGALLAASAVLFTVVKIVGGLYLLHLGVRMLRAGFSASEVWTHAAPESHRRLFLNTYLVTAFNPKSIMFFLAFLPQFVDRSSDVTQQLLLLATTFVVMAAANAGLYCVFAGSASRLVGSARAQRRLNLTGGSLLSFAGMWALLARHSA